MSSEVKKPKIIRKTSRLKEKTSWVIYRINKNPNPPTEKDNIGKAIFEFIKLVKQS